MPPFDILHLVAGPDRRSLGRSPVVIRRVLRDPALLPALIRGLSVNDPVVRMRTADALEKVARLRLHSVARYRARLLRVASTSQQPEVQWHMAQLLPRLSLSARQRIRARRVLRRYLHSPSSIVRTMALEALTRLAPGTPAGQRSALRLLQAASRSGTPAMRARARRLLQRKPRGGRSSMP